MYFKNIFNLVSLKLILNNFFNINLIYVSVVEVNDNNLRKKKSRTTFLSSTKINQTKSIPNK